MDVFRYRVAEVRYRRVSSGKDRIETVLLLVPDVWSCLPTAGQWEETVRSYVQPYGEDQSKASIANSNLFFLLPVFFLLTSFQFEESCLVVRRYLEIFMPFFFLRFFA